MSNLKHAQRERLIFLDHCLTWRGAANRRDLMDHFGISSAQAALDFKFYLANTPTPPAYDTTRKTYLAIQGHRPMVPSSLPSLFDDLLNTKVADQAATVPRPTRRVDAGVIARLYQALKAGKALYLNYTSMSTGADTGQWIAPVRFTSDGESVHLRAFSFKHNAYRTYLPIRMDPKSTFETRPLEAPLPEDEDWHTLALIWLRPKADLSDAQATVVRREYGFEDDLLCIRTRKALEFYLDRRWALDLAQSRLERVKTEYRRITD